MAVSTRVVPLMKSADTIFAFVPSSFRYNWRDAPIHIIGHLAQSAGLVQNDVPRLWGQLRHIGHRATGEATVGIRNETIHVPHLI